MRTLRMHIAINPPWRDLPRVNALLNGNVRSNYVVTEYETTLSIKAVAAGEAWYWTPQGRYRVTPDVFLILNDGQRYSMEAERGTETLCPFFAPGFVEGALQAEATPEERLLENPDASHASAGFIERLHPMRSPVGTILRSLHAARNERRTSQPLLEEAFYGMAAALVALRREDGQRMHAIPALRRATREELYRRLCRARDFLSSAYADRVTVADAASVAALSPFHFQRSFKAAFGVSPMQFLQLCRLEVARDLLSRGARVSDAVAAVGFESHGSFTTLFRRRFGVSPRAVQKSRIEEVETVEQP